MPIKNRRFVRIDGEVHDITAIVHHSFASITRDSTVVTLYVREVPDLDLVGNPTWVEWNDGTISMEMIITGIETPNENLQDYIDKYKDPIIEKVIRSRQYHSGKLIPENIKNPTLSLPLGSGTILHIERVWWYKDNMPSFIGEDYILTITDTNNNIMNIGGADHTTIQDYIKQLSQLTSVSMLPKT